MVRGRLPAQVVDDPASYQSIYTLPRLMRINKRASATSNFDEECNTIFMANVWERDKNVVFSSGKLIYLTTMELRHLNLFFI